MSEETKQENSQAEEPKNTSNKIVVAVVLLGFILLILIILFTVVYRTARNSDIYVDSNNDFSLKINIQITPHQNIDHLELTFTFLDSEKKAIESKTHVMGNVMKDNRYTISYSLTDFTISQLSVIKYVECNVTGGRLHPRLLTTSQIMPTPIATTAYGSLV